MLTAKQERFAQLIASEDISQVAAYVDAGYSSTQLQKQLRTKASALALNGDIVGRVAELRATAADAAGVTRDGHLAKLAEIRDMALEGDKYETLGGLTKTVRNYGAAVQAEGLRGKHSGIAAPDKHQNVDPDVKPEEAIKDLCTQNGALNVPAPTAGMEMLRLRRSPAPFTEDDVKPDAVKTMERDVAVQAIMGGVQ